LASARARAKKAFRMNGNAAVDETAAAELGIEYPRHAVVGLSEQGTHEYAVRLESLGRATDVETKKYPALDLWHDDRVKTSKTRLAGLIGVDERTIRRWIVEDEEKNGTRRSTPAEPERVPDALGRLQPTSHRRGGPATNGDVAHAAEAVEAGPEEDEEEDAGPPEPGQYPGREPTPNAMPTVGEIQGPDPEPFDDAGLAEAEAARKRRRYVVDLRIELLRLVQGDGPAVMVEGERPEDLPVLGPTLDLLIDWLTRARKLASDPRAQIRRVP
jgi:hypothetical protein